MKKIESLFGKIILWDFYLVRRLLQLSWHPHPAPWLRPLSFFWQMPVERSVAKKGKVSCRQRAIGLG
jgi:hypothetical protein